MGFGFGYKKGETKDNRKKSGYGISFKRKSKSTVAGKNKNSSLRTNTVEQVLESVTRLLRLDNVRIGIKINLAFAIIIVLSLSIVVYISLDKVKVTLVDNAKSSTLQLMQQTGTNIKMMLEEIDRLTQAVSLDNEIALNIIDLNKSESDINKTRLVNQISAKLNTYYGTRSDIIADMIAFSPKGYGSLAGEGTITGSLELHGKTILDTVAVKEYFASESKSFWLDTYVADTAYTRMKAFRVITLIKPVRASTSLKPVGYLQTNISEKCLFDIVKSIEVPNGGSMFIVGKDGNMVMNPKNTEDNGYLVSELSRITSDGKTMVELLGKAGKDEKGMNVIDFYTVNENQLSYKLDTDLSIAEDQYRKLRARDNYPTEEILETLYEEIKDVDGKQSGQVNGEEVVSGILEGIKINANDMLLTFYHIKEIKGVPLDWTLMSLTPVSVITKQVNDASRQILLIGLLCLVLGAVFSIIISTDILSGIKTLIMSMSQIEKGNLDVRYALGRKDEIGRLGNSFNDMVDNLKKLIGSVKDASKVAIDSSQTVSSTCEQNYASIEEFSSMLQLMEKEVLAQTTEIDNNGMVIQELSNQITGITKDFKEVDTIISGAKDLSQNGKITVNKLQENAVQVKDTIHEFSKSISALKKESGEISKITGVMKNVAKQTNLLALNAAIEAAKAGEAGKSFSIVATEIRKLAEQSKESATYIENKLKNIGETIELTGGLVTASDNVINEHDSVVFSTIERFDSIVDFMDRIFGQMQSMNKSLSKIEDIRTNIILSMEKLNEGSKHNIADIQSITISMNEQVKLIEHLLSLAEDLQTLSRRLEDTINIFKV